jgi:hypothetical protein
MNIQELFSSKTIKPKEKIETLSKWLFEANVSIDDFISFIQESKDSMKATCIESLESATKEKPMIVDAKCFEFITSLLLSKTPRVKWESARVIGNTAHLFTDNLEEVIKNLLINAEHHGTVVRWGTAFALSEIAKLKTKHNHSLLKHLRVICEQEEKSSIKKIYTDAMDEINK